MDMPELVLELERVGRLEGNVGRKVARLLERLMPGGTLEMPLHCAAVDDLVEQALYLIRLDGALEPLRKQLCERHCSALVRSTGVLGGAAVSITCSRIDESMRARQDLLELLALTLRACVRASAATTREALEHLRRLYCVDTAPEGRLRDHQLLRELVDVDQPCLESAPLYAVHLATRLEPRLMQRLGASTTA